MDADPTQPMSMLRAVIRDEAGHRVDLSRFFQELSAPPRADELSAEHEVVGSMAAEIRAHQPDDRPRSAGRSAFRSMARVAIVTGTIVMTAGSSLALVGGLPGPPASSPPARSPRLLSRRPRVASWRLPHH